ncbi:TIGR03885 family FMN-dependent LLM class oxidoreductase [Occultella glacieicola]|uniref:TIGR03885 family FMN-dependent LLM class oxidoreductase n=1 Tax=Occultella glacieicola TaxID=2518684 RepID=A0ABY2E9B7_9MICO|nr:TIGR03885 family FMN-dependent LLM class oxidoreductase [Occultella glacieicola]TDE97365.1 TIGR03885 family FMN-dependent LLM class oxidoreductase [Occultella glacieicola]
MTRIGFHASHEQASPRQLLRDVQHAEKVGFDMAMCSDHIAPWSRRQGHAGNAWAWLGAALALTRFPVGSLAIPGARYHPAVLAHQLSTLAQMFPGRVWVALGSGEAMNEHITAVPWPRKETRVQRLEASVAIIRDLLAGEEVSRDGPVAVDRARLWDLPEDPPLLLAPAISADSASRVAAWADGLVTVVQPVETLREVVAAYRGAGGRGRLALQLHLSWASTEEEALALAHDQWRSNVFAPPAPADTMTTEAFDAFSARVPLEAVTQTVRVSADLGRHRAWIGEYAGLGFDDIYLHHVGQAQDAFLDVFGDQVLPAAREGGRS